VWLYTADGQLCRYQGRKGGYLGDSDEQQLPGVDSGEIGAALGGGRIGGCLRFVRGGVLQLNRASRWSRSWAWGKLDLLLASQRGGAIGVLVDGRVQKWQGNRLERDWGAYPWDGWRDGLRGLRRFARKPGGRDVWGQGESSGSTRKARRTCLSTNDGLSEKYDFVIAIRSRGQACGWGRTGGGLNRVKRQVFDEVGAMPGVDRAVSG